MGSFLSKVETGAPESVQSPPKVAQAVQAAQAVEKDSSGEKEEAIAIAESSEKIALTTEGAVQNPLDSAVKGETAAKVDSETKLDSVAKEESVAKEVSVAKEESVAKGEESPKEQHKEELSDPSQQAAAKVVDSQSDVQQTEDNKEQMTKKIQAKNIALLIEASKIPLPPSPCVDSKTTSVIKNRDVSGVESSRKLDETFGASDTISSAPGDHKAVDGKDSETADVELQPVSDNLEQKNLEAKFSEEDKNGSELNSPTKRIPNDEEMGGHFKVISEEELKLTDEELNATREAAVKCEDFVAQQEAKVPVEELADQLSQVVISSASEELCQEKKADVKEIMKMEITTVDNSSEKPPGSSEKEDLRHTDDVGHDSSSKMEKHEIITAEVMETATDKKEEHEIQEST